MSFTSSSSSYYYYLSSPSPSSGLLLRLIVLEWLMVLPVAYMWGRVAPYGPTREEPGQTAVTVVAVVRTGVRVTPMAVV